MDMKEFFAALDDIEQEKKIPKSYMLDRISQAFVTVLRRDYPQAFEAETIIVRVDEDAAKIEGFLQKTVADAAAMDEAADSAIEERAARMAETDEFIEDMPIPRRFSQDLHISIEDAAAYTENGKAELGDIVNVPVELTNFGRVAAQTVKQVIVQGIREAERGMVYDAFTSKEGTLLTGSVTRIERNGGAAVRVQTEMESTDAILYPSEQIPGDRLYEGDLVKAYVTEVRANARGPQVILSRTHPNFVRRLFEVEVPEISAGTLEIISIAREAGSRTKIAVQSLDSDVDPIGACVGPRGGRVGTIVDELRGEKIDIIPYDDDPTAYIAASLAPAQVLRVTLESGERACHVVVPETQLSLAIGKDGQNARLAARLTGYKIDIVAEEG